MPFAFDKTPPGDIRVENPDGVSFSRGDTSYNNLRNRTSPPMIQSGDFQTRQVRYAPSKGGTTDVPNGN
jgi:hypothetical protein